jgi:hypothetical protein
MSQSHFTLEFPLKSPADAKVITEQLPALMPDFLKVQDSLGTIHYSRFTPRPGSGSASLGLGLAAQTVPSGYPGEAAEAGCE